MQCLSKTISIGWFPKPPRIGSPNPRKLVPQTPGILVLDPCPRHIPVSRCVSSIQLIIFDSHGMPERSQEPVPGCKSRGQGPVSISTVSGKSPFRNNHQLVSGIGQDRLFLRKSHEIITSSMLEIITSSKQSPARCLK